LKVLLPISVGLLGERAPAEPAAEQDCRVVRQGERIELQSPLWVFRLDAAAGLRAKSFENRLTGRSLLMGDGAELDLDIGSLGGPLQTPKWQVTELPAAVSAAAGEAVFTMVANEPAITARVTYRWNATEPVLRKFVVITNSGEREVMLLNLRLGTYRTPAKLVEREQGFPIYLDDEFFMSVAHPAGWATGKESEVSLRQYPGTKLAPAQAFTAMETVYGVSKAGEARKSFVAHVRSRMRRVVRKHDHPYAIFDNFGSWSLKIDGFVENTERNELYSLNRLAESQQATGCRFDLCNIHFWVDHTGDLIRFDPKRFPNGLAKIKQKLDEMGVAPGLWIDSSMCSWSVGSNPATKPSLTDDAGFFCRASEPIKSMYLKAFRHHIRENDVREIKFDNLRTTCNNPNHPHLPGIYSTEAIENAVIEFLHALDEECPDVFLILYWGHRSPWWLLHGDTLFDSGIGIEAATPSSQPSTYARDSVTQKLDQAQWHSSDVPVLGKDSLGVWLSDWGWNSSVGKERWQEGFVMEICRGSLLAQVWADCEWLSPPEWQQLADLIGLLRAQPACFANPRFILGNPYRDEPYGYCCTDGQRAFLALNNCTWKDNVVTLTLNSAWGLPDGQTWSLYRWYPSPAQLKGSAETFGETAAIALRPFEVVLLEAVPAGQSPSLRRTLAVAPVPEGFAEASKTVGLTVQDIKPKREPESDSMWRALDPIEARSAAGATLTKQSDRSILVGGETPPTDTYTITAKTDLSGITGIRLDVLPDPSLPSGGPGRVFNGNFALNEFQVMAGPQDARAAAARVELCNPVADFSQESHGGWPVTAMIDGDPKTGWSIDPEEGAPHVALFETKTPVGFPGGTKLIFTLQHGERQHTIGKLRLSVTTAKPPFPKPQDYGPRKLFVQGQAPASTQGGILVVAVQLGQGSELAHLGNIGTHFSAEGRIAGQDAHWRPVLGTETYPSSWQAWRIAVGPSTTPQPFELAIGTRAPINAESGFTAHFLPSSR
jgi:hypothetical protein